MIWKDSNAPTRALAAFAAIAGMAIFTSPAMAASTGQVVSGTTQSSISLALGTAPLFTTNFAPGNTATASGTLVATDTSAAPVLTVQDQAAANAGKMHAAATGCTGSEAFLANPLSVTITGTGVTSSGAVSLSGTAQQVASATAPIAATTLTTSYSQTIGSAETMLTGCVYSLTATYTLS